MTKESKSESIPDKQTVSFQCVDAIEISLFMESSQKKALIEFLSSLLEKEKKLDVKAVFSHLMVKGKKHLAPLKDLKKKI